MLSLLVVPFLVLGGFEAGGRVGVVFPASGLEQTHNSSAALGLSLCYSAGSSRILLDYSYCGLSARQASPYRLDVHDLALGYGLEFFQRNGWGFEASAQAGYSLLRRTLASATESGKSPLGHVGLGFFQRQGKSRLSVGLDNAVFIESAKSGSTSVVSATWLPALKAGVGYAF
jgi:hypothetical protein